MTFNQLFFQRVAASASPPTVLIWCAYFFAQWSLWLAPATLILLWIGGSHKDRLSAVYATLTALLALAMAGIVSALYFHPRPFMDGLAPNRLDHLPDSSFPSDHATLLFAVAFAFYRQPPPLHPRLWASAIALALIVAWSRVYLGVHYPLDMVGSMLLALAAGIVLSAPILQSLNQKLTQLGEGIYGALVKLVRR